MGRNYEFSKAEIERARQTNVVSFLEAQGERVKRVGREWEWYHNGEKISITGWKWFSQYNQEGGNAIEFVMKYCQADFASAVRMLLGGSYFGIVAYNVSSETTGKCVEPKEFVMPEKYRNMDRVRKYLCGERGISPDVVRYFAAGGLIFEDAKYHNAVFLGCDEDGIPRHAHKRASYRGSDFKCTSTGSRMEYSFHHTGTSGTIYVFEAPIDMLSFITMYPDKWQEDSYVALCSVAPAALFHQLKENPDIKEIKLCLDSDDAGMIASQRIAAQLRDTGRDYTVSILTPSHKDWNEDLIASRQPQEMAPGQGAAMC